jgi:hypothetical protein
MRLRESSPLAQLANVENLLNFMATQLMSTLLILLAVAAGGVIGYCFGLIQNLALRRNERKLQSGALTNGWAVMPGSMTRVAYLLIVLVVVQFLCPLLFKDGTQWWVSAGLVMGYGYVLFRRLIQRKAGPP